VGVNLSAKDSMNKRITPWFDHEHYVYADVCSLLEGHLKKINVLTHKGYVLCDFFWLVPLTGGYFKVLANIRDLIEMLYPTRIDATMTPCSSSNTVFQMCRRVGMKQ
jgi:hypothetical protein